MGRKYGVRWGHISRKIGTVSAVSPAVIIGGMRDAAKVEAQAAEIRRRMNVAGELAARAVLELGTDFGTDRTVLAVST